MLDKYIERKEKGLVKIAMTSKGPAFIYTKFDSLTGDKDPEPQINPFNPTELYNLKEKLEKQLMDVKEAVKDLTEIGAKNKTSKE